MLVTNDLRLNISSDGCAVLAENVLLAIIKQEL